MALGGEAPHACDTGAEGGSDGRAPSLVRRCAQAWRRPTGSRTRAAVRRCLARAGAQETPIASGRPSRSLWRNEPVLVPGIWPSSVSAALVIGMTGKSSCHDAEQGKIHLQKLTNSP